MRTLVTGASGFLGSWTVRALGAAGHTVTAIVRSAAPWRLASLEDVEVVVAPPDKWADLIRRTRPDALVCLDWSGVSSRSRDSRAQWENLTRQRELFQASIEAGAARIVGAGSQAEYGLRADRIKETAALAPVTEYGAAKVAALDQLTTMCESAGITAVWARVFSVYGPMDNDGVLFQLVADSLRAGRGIDLSSGEQPWSYLYGADAGRAIAVLAADDTATGVYNVGHPDAPHLRDTIEQFSHRVGFSGKLRFGGIPSNPNSIRRLEPNVDRLISLGWAPETSLRDGLDATAGWLAGATLADPFAAGRSLPRRVV